MNRISDDLMFQSCLASFGYSLFSMRKSPLVSDHVLPGFDKVPSTPPVSIEISLTNKNRLVVLFTQWGCYFVELLYLRVFFQGSLFLSPGFDWIYSYFYYCFYNKM